MPTPAAVVAKVARPELSVAVPSDVVPLRKVTVPVGVPVVAPVGALTFTV